jgi:hypothetical protein
LAGALVVIASSKPDGQARRAMRRIPDIMVRILPIIPMAWDSGESLIFLAFQP